MPEMDGITASRTVKMELRDQAPYIIACTADLQYDTRTACAQAGIDNYLEKVHLPYQPSRSLPFHDSSRPRCLASSYSPQIALPCSANQAQGLGQGVRRRGDPPSSPARRSRPCRLVSLRGPVTCLAWLEASTLATSACGVVGAQRPAAPGREVSPLRAPFPLERPLREGCGHCAIIFTTACVADDEQLSRNVKNVKSELSYILYIP